LPLRRNWSGIFGARASPHTCPTLMGFAAPRSIVGNRLAGILGSPLPQSFAVSSGLRGVSPTTVPRSLAKPGSSSHELHASSEPTDTVPPARRHARSLPGVSAPFATSAGRVAVVKQGSPALPRRRPQGFSPSRRFAPPPALWAYFIPQPRPGFALQGFCLRRSRSASSASRALLVLRARTLPSVARGRQTRFRATFRAFPRHNPSRSASG